MTDPIDRLRTRNPASLEEGPPAPMALADRIMRERERSPRASGWLVATSFATVVVAVGAVWLLWLGGGGDSGPVAIDSTTTAVTDPTTLPTTTDASATTDQPGTTSGTGDPQQLVTPVVYLFVDPVSDGFPEGPTLLPVQRAVIGTSGDPLVDALTALVSGPTEIEATRQPVVSSAIPEGTRLAGVARGPAVSIDLTGVSLEAIDERALAQIVFTATQVENAWVAVTVDGIPVVEDTLDRPRFDAYLPAIFIETPPYGGGGTNPLVVSGTANVFEATVSYMLTDAEGEEILAEGFTTASCGTGCRGTFAFEVEYSVPEAQSALLVLWEESAMDGSMVNVREHAVSLAPAPPSSAGLSIDENSFASADDDPRRIDLRWPQILWEDRPDVADAINKALDAYVQSLNRWPAQGESGEYRVGYEIVWVGDTLLSIRLNEYFFGGTAPLNFTKAFVFDLSDGSVIEVADLLGEGGVEAFGNLVQTRVDDLDPDFTPTPGELVDDVAVAPGGLIVYLDTTDGVPRDVGRQQVAFAWRQIEGLVDPDGPLGAIDRRTCDTTDVGPLTDQAGLPAAVAATRAVIFAVAPTCDFGTLSELTSNAGFRYSFGVDDDPEGFWTEREVMGVPLMQILARTLNLSYEIIENPDGPDLYVWPGAFPYAWEEVPDDRRAELAEIYSEEEIQGYAEFGAFIGWRVGINEDGEWQFFVAGD
jgi:hypothetical protein